MVGINKFVFKIKQVLGGKAAGREVFSDNGTSGLREPLSSYNADFMPENDRLRAKKMHYWRIYSDNSIG
jgi:hypothetical protein